MQSFLSCLLFLVLVLPCAAALQVADLIQSYGRQGGIVVQLGCDDLDLFATLHGQGRFTVQALDRDAAAVAKARAHLQAKGIYGPASARRLEGETLPYNDNLINLLVASADQKIPDT